MKRLQGLLLSSFMMTGCASDKPVEVKQREEALHRGLTEAAKKADPAKNLKEASDAIRTFKISDAADAGLKRHQAKQQQGSKANPSKTGQPEQPSKPCNQAIPKGNPHEETRHFDSGQSARAGPHSSTHLWRLRTFRHCLRSHR